jgi:hypothetical protein
MFRPLPGRMIGLLLRTFLLSHSHEPAECAASFAAWSGMSSPLRGEVAWAGCAHGEHRVYWRVEAAGKDEALALLPRFVAERTLATPIREVLIP